MEWVVIAVLAVLLAVSLGKNLTLSRSLSREVILRLLRSGPSYGLELIRDSDGALGRGSVYVHLRDLEDEGLLTSWEEPDTTGVRGGRPRRRYALTGHGPEDGIGLVGP